MAKSSKLIIKLNPNQVSEVAYWIAAMADSSDKADSESLAQKLYEDLGFSAQTVLDAQESRREVNAYRHRRIIREWRLRAIERRRQEAGEVQA